MRRLLLISLVVALPELGTGAQASTALSGYSWRLVADIHPAPLFYQADGIATGVSGNIFIADAGDRRVEKFSPAGALLTSWGTDAAGPLHLEGPRAIAVDAGGNVFLAGNGAIKLSFTGKFLARWTGGVLSYPRGLAVDRRRDVYVLSLHPVPHSSSFDRITITKLSWGGKRLGSFVYAYPEPVADAALGAAIAIRPNGNLLLSIEAQRHCHDCDGTYYLLRTLSPTGKTLAEIDEAAGGGSITVDPAGNIYLSAPHAIEKLSPKGILVATFGSAGCGDGLLGSDLRIAAASLGSLYVADSQITAAQAGAGVLHSFTFGGAPRPLLGACPSPDQQTQFGQINDLAVTPRGTVYVADGVASKVYRLGRDGGIAGSIRANHPSTVSVDAGGNVYVPDLINDTLDKFAPNGQLLARRNIFGVESAVVARNGNVYALTNDGGVQVLPPFGKGDTPTHRWRLVGYPPGSGGLDPEGICLDGQGNVWVADIRHNNIQKFSPTGRLLLIWGRGGTGPGHFHNPNGLAVDGRGHLLVLDGNNNRVQEFDLRGHFLRAFGREGQAPGQFQRPWGIGADASGDIYVGDRGNDRIQELVRGS